MDNEVFNVVIDQLTPPLLHIHPFRPCMLMSLKLDTLPYMIEHWPCYACLSYARMFDLLSLRL